VTLYQGNKPIEMFQLDEKLRFQKKYDSLPMVFLNWNIFLNIKHYLLEEGDSLWVRINAAAFDESIVYSGSGASKNNFLMELFLKQEKENQYLIFKILK